MLTAQALNFSKSILGSGPKLVRNWVHKIRLDMSPGPCLGLMSVSSMSRVLSVDGYWESWMTMTTWKYFSCLTIGMHENGFHHFKRWNFKIVKQIDLSLFISLSFWNALVIKTLHEFHTEGHDKWTFPFSRIPQVRMISNQVRLNSFTSQESDGFDLPIKRPCTSAQFFVLFFQWTSAQF